MCQQQICLSNAMYMPQAHITQCVSKGIVCQYMYHIWTHWHKPCDQECCTDNNNANERQGRRRSLFTLVESATDQSSQKLYLFQAQKIYLQVHARFLQIEAHGFLLILRIPSIVNAHLHIYDWDEMRWDEGGRLKAASSITSSTVFCSYHSLEHGPGNFFFFFFFFFFVCLDTHNANSRRIWRREFAAISCWIRSNVIRSFVCNTKRPSVKQSIKRQVSSNFQIYPGKS